MGIHLRGPVRHYHPAGQSIQQKPPGLTAAPWDSPGLFAMQAPGISGVRYAPEELPHCFDSCQPWGQLAKQASGCGHLVSPVRSPWSWGFIFSTEVNGLFEKLWPDFSTENTIRNYREELDVTPQHLANWSHLLVLVSRYRQPILPLYHNYRTTEPLLVKLRDTPGF